MTLYINNKNLEIMKTLRLCIALCVCFSMQSHAQHTTIFFLDHSGSISKRADQIAREAILLKTVLLQNITEPDDRALISYLYRNSASVSNVKEFVFTLPRNSKQPQTEIEKAQQQSQLMQAKFGFINRVSQVLQTSEEKSDQTRILEILPRINEVLKISEKVTVIFFSDMLESSPRRQLTRIHSKTDAETKARQDVSQLMQDFGLSTSKNPELTITCYLPLGELENNTSFQFIEYYWLTVFEYLFGTNNLKFITL